MKTQCENSEERAKKTFAHYGYSLEKGAVCNEFPATRDGVREMFVKASALVKAMRLGSRCKFTLDYDPDYPFGLFRMETLSNPDQ